MKQILLIFLFNLFFTIIYSQRIIDNSLLNDIDDYNESDIFMPKLKLSTLELYSCQSNQNSKDSCLLFWIKKYDESGRLIEQIKGNNLDKNEIDFEVKYQKLSDTLFESITKYPKTSQKVPENMFIDTLIKGKKQRICLYKRDREQNIVMRSLYRINSNNDISNIKRFDLDNKLIDIYYPWGSRKPKIEWTDTLVGEYENIITYNAIFEENKYKSINIFDKKKRLIESSYSNSTFAGGSNDVVRKIFVYDEQNHLIIITTVDENNQLISVERYYYKKNILKRYTKSTDISNEFFNEDKHYDDFGNLTYFLSRPSAPENSNVWKYYINEKGLCEKREFYVNNLLQSILIYSYK
jgi:hypothetical protein